MIQGVDYSWARPSPAGLFRAGKRFALRYVSPDTSGKNLTTAERDRLWNAGLKILLLWEDTAGRALAGHAAGVADATHARSLARNLGYPAELPIIYAIDFNATPSQLSGPVAAYVAGINSVDHVAEEYGGIRTIDFLVAHRLATGGFQTYAWSAGKWSAHAVIEQYHNNVTVAGGVVDLCRADENLSMWEPPVTKEDIANIVAALKPVIKAEVAAALTDPTTVKAVAAAMLNADVAWAARPPVANGDFGDPSNPADGNKLWQQGYQGRDTNEKARMAVAGISNLTTLVQQLVAPSTAAGTPAPGTSAPGAPASGGV